MSNKTKIFRSKNLPIALFALIFGGLGTFLVINSFAATAPSVYLLPDTQTTPGLTEFTVEVREDSGTNTSVNAVQANLSYPETLLEVVSIDNTATPARVDPVTGNQIPEFGFPIVAEKTFGNGVIKIGFGNTSNKSGDQPVALIRFKSKSPASTSVANVNFTSGTALISSTTNTDILGTLNSTTAPGGVYTITGSTPSNASVTYPTSGAKIKGTVTATASASDPEGVASVQFKLDSTNGTDGTNIGAADTTSPYSVSWNSTATTDGNHTIMAIATDVNGQKNNSTPVSFTVDNTAPDTTITSANPGSISNTSQSFTFTSSETGSTFECSIDSGAYSACTSPKAYTGLAVGSHAFNVRATDSTGNLDATPATQAWTVTTPADTTAPTVSITAPVNNATVSGSNVSVTATASDNVGVAGVKFYLDQTPPNGQLGNEDTTPPYGTTLDTITLANGSHTLRAVARDAAGNTTTSAVITVTVNNVVTPTPDVTPPTVPTNLRSTATSENSISLAWNSSTDPPGALNEIISGVNNYTVYRSTSANGTYTALPAVTATSLVNTGLTASTTYYYKVLATDNAGKSSAQSASISATTAAATVPVPGDVDGNRTVDYLDLSQLLGHWGQNYAPADFKKDGTSANRIDIYDLSVLLSNYGRNG